MALRIDDGAPPWLRRAHDDLGVAEVAGKENHPRIMQMYATVGHPEIESEETSWCAAGVGAWLKESGYPIPPRANNLMAMSYETYGKRLDHFRAGCIVVSFRTKIREKDWRRHVSIGIRETATHIECIGANQSNKVSITKVAKKDVVAMRWPVAATVNDLRNAGSSDIELADTLKKVAVTTIGTAATGAAAQQATSPPAPIAPTLPDLSLTQANEQVTAFNVFMESANAVAKMVAANPWLAAGLVAGIGGYWLARRLERKRVERAQLGHALSVAG